MSATILIKRPVAFRVPRADPATAGQTISATEWRLFNDEAEARAEAEGLGVDYQGLYARDGAAMAAEMPREIDDAALSVAIAKMRKLRLVDYVPIKDSPPPAVTFLAVMKTGLGGNYEDAALEYIFRHFLKYYERERS